MNTHIVVGAAQTPAGERALAWAAKRARDRSLPLRLVSVVGGATGVVGEGPVVEEALREAEEYLAAHTADLTSSGVSVQTEVVRGDPVAQLIAASEGASMLVIGSDARGDAKGPRRGVHGIRVAAGAACPVVVVPDIDTAERAGVVVGVDGSPISEAAIAFAAEEADRLGEPLIAVAVWTPLVAPRHSIVYPEDYLRGMQAMTEEALALSLAGLRQRHPDLEIVQHAERGYPSQVLGERASSARLVVVGSHGRGPIARFLLGSISHEVLTNIATVTAVVRNREGDPRR